MPDSTPLSTEDVLKVARLARLALPPDQIEDYRGKLAAVIGYAARLQSLDLSGIEPLSSPMEVTTVLAEDVPGETLPMSVLMQMAPDTYPPFVRVPKVMGE